MRWVSPVRGSPLGWSLFARLYDEYRGGEEISIGRPFYDHQNLRRYTASWAERKPTGSGDGIYALEL